MKKTALTATLAASALALAACSGGSGGDIVTSKEFGNITTEQFNEMGAKLTGPFVLKQMLTEKVLSEKYEVTDKEIEESMKPVKEQYGDEFAEALASSGLTVDGFKESLRVQLLQEKALMEHALKKEDIEKIYEQGKQELNGRHILVEDEETAKKALEEIKGGANFADVAKKYSSDTVSKEKGGELGWFQQGTMVQAFNDAAYALELNTISEPVQSDFGFYIIEITDKRDVKDYGTFEEKEDAIREAELQKLNQTGEAKVMIEEIVAKLLQESDFKTENADLKDALKLFTEVPKEPEAPAQEAPVEEAPADEAPADEEKEADKK